MPGLLSSIFDSSSATEPDDGSSSHAGSTSHEAGGAGEVHADPSITIGISMNGSYESPDGTSHGWERSDEVTVTTDTHLGVAVDSAATVGDEAM